VLALAQDVLLATGSRSPIRFVDRPVDDPGVRRPDIRLARRLLGCEPAVSWPEGLAATVAWFRGLGATERTAAARHAEVVAYGRA
jgi:dTDP-glucose 4,6-dehydratase